MSVPGQATDDTRPPLPQPRGELSAALVRVLEGTSSGNGDRASALARPPTDPFAEDFQLALYLLYELHYRSFRGIDERLEWQPSLIALRGELESIFEDALRDLAPGDIPPEPEQVGGRIRELVEESDGPDLAGYLARSGSLEEFQEFLIHRSAYQLKEADPHTWAIPRLEGPPKAALVEVQADEYGGGRPARVHATLFAKAMGALGLDPSYGAYLERIPAVTLATVNLMSLCGLHRRLRGAIVGHLAGFELSSPIPNGRYAKGLRRLGLGEDALDFFDEHVEADSVHENIAAYDLAQGLAVAEPDLVPDIFFGLGALIELDRRFASHLLDSWVEGRSSLLPAASAAPPGDDLTGAAQA